ncbi:MAG TPA: pilus assembly protein TadG-related protein [Burkholderiaceae bacterium]|nr:pilus assembly protein TadG-related protein [Burkholderiaceae bacterium]
MRTHNRTRQRGTVAIIAAIALPILIGFAGLALDGGRLYMHKTELQNAADACALAASRELTCDPAAGPCAASFLLNAENSGLTVGQRNFVDFQGTAVGNAQLAASDITFSKTYAPASSYLSRAAGADPASKYVMCTTHQSGILPWFMEVLGVGGQSVAASAVATLSRAATNCAIPIGLCKIPGPSSDPFAGLTVGQWVTSKLSSSATGSFDWIDFTPPGGGASELADLLKGTGVCSVPAPPVQVGEQGNITSLDTAWNTRFGLYKGSDSIATAAPDYTGYAYTPTNWPSKFNAYSGSSGSEPNFLTARTQHKSWQGNASTGGTVNMGGVTVATSAQLTTSGADRRLVTAPVVDCAAWAGGTGSQQVPILGYACVLMLAPMGKSDPETYLEYLGKSTDLTSPCASSGSVGGPAAEGPLVPALVQ